MKRCWLLAIMVGIFCSTAPATEVGDRVVRSAVVLREIMGIRENGIPRDLLDKCYCVAVIPSMKRGGFIFGGDYGKGVITCRTNRGDGPWSAPSMLLLGGGTFGLQIGGQAVDLVLVVMNINGLDSLLDTKFTLGGDASVAAGPVGRTAAAQTDAFMKAKILAYSRSRGIFGGLTLKGAVLRPDKDANVVLYGSEKTPHDLLFTPMENPPKDVQILLNELNSHSPKRLP